MRFLAAGWVLLSVTTFAGPTPQPPDSGATPRTGGDVDERWEQRVRSLPETWPGGTYAMTDGRARVEYRHERVRQDGRELLRLTDRVTFRGAQEQEATAVMTWLCQPDRFLTPVRFTAGKAEEPPTSDLTFGAGRVTGMKGGEKIDQPVPDGFVPHELLDRWVALMPFVPKARRQVRTFNVLRLEEHTLEVVCDGSAEMVVNDRKQRVWSIRTREPAAADPEETQRWYLFSDRRTLQKFVQGATPMSEMVPTDATR